MPGTALHRCERPQQEVIGRLSLAHGVGPAGAAPAALWKHKRMSIAREQRTPRQQRRACQVACAAGMGKGRDKRFCILAVAIDRGCVGVEETCIVQTVNGRVASENLTYDIPRIDAMFASEPRQDGSERLAGRVAQRDGLNAVQLRCHSSARSGSTPAPTAGLNWAAQHRAAGVARLPCHDQSRRSAATRSSTRRPPYRWRWRQP